MKTFQTHFKKIFLEFVNINDIPSYNVVFNYIFIVKIKNFVINNIYKNI